MKHQLLLKLICVWTVLVYAQLTATSSTPFCYLHGHVNAYYERGRIHFDNGRVEECVTDLMSFIEVGGDSTKVASDMHLLQGEAYNEMALYDEAISVLSDLIQKHPENKEAHYQRAVAYFETGSFDDAAADFLNSDKLQELAKVKREVSQLYADGLLQGISQGFHESVEEFFPSMCNSLYGIASALWTAAETPGKSLSDFLNSCHHGVRACVECMQTTDMQAVFDEYGAELETLVRQYESLSDLERGHLTGYLMGKYGTEVLSGALLFEGIATIKDISAAKKIKDAVRNCNLEALVSSQANKEILLSQAANHNLRRHQFFENRKIHWGRQQKHIPGSQNYRSGSSILTHSDAEGLLKKFAGKGRPSSLVTDPTIPGYREIVDFGEVIGLHVNKETGVQTITSWGQIHYSKFGDHIVPVFPKTRL